MIMKSFLSTVVLTLAMASAAAQTDPSAQLPSVASCPVVVVARVANPELLLVDKERFQNMYRQTLDTLNSSEIGGDTYGRLYLAKVERVLKGKSPKQIGIYFSGIGFGHSPSVTVLPDRLQVLCLDSPAQSFERQLQVVDPEVGHTSAKDIGKSAIKALFRNAPIVYPVSSLSDPVIGRFKMQLRRVAHPS